MDSRMSKYNSNDEKVSRVKRNQEKYDNIAKNDLDNFNVLSNATVIGENKRNQIDIDKIKKILDNKYNESPKRKTISLDMEEDSKYSDPEFEDTKEYDINNILNKARSEKIINYEEDRLKKIRNTQFNILNNLSVEKEELEEKTENKTEKNNLMNLINTITINESKLNSKEDLGISMDLFEELKGSGKTEVVKPVTAEEPIIKNIEEIKKDENPIDAQKEFYTSSTKFNKKDFDDLGDIEKDGKNIVTIIIVIVILLAFIAGMFIFAKSIFNF